MYDLKHGMPLQWNQVLYANVGWRKDCKMKTINCRTQSFGEHNKTFINVHVNKSFIVLHVVNACNTLI